MQRPARLERRGLGGADGVAAARRHQPEHQATEGVGVALLHQLAVAVVHRELGTRSGVGDLELLDALADLEARVDLRRDLRIGR